jgi:hypothetical protein
MKEKREMGQVAYVEPDVITEEERAIQMGESVGDAELSETEDKQTDEGTGTLEADKPAQETEKPAVEAKATETKVDPDKLTEEERKDIESQGFKVETDKKGRTYITDSEGTKVPEKRFGQIYRKGKEADTLKQENEQLKEKQTLYRQLGAEGYYSLFPDEKPEGWKPAQPAPQHRPQQAIPQNVNILDGLQVTQPGHQYQGMTLREVMQIDPDTGTALLSQWKDAQQANIRQQEERVTQAQQAQVNESNAFVSARAKELFNIDDASKLNPDQNRKLVLLGQEVIDWQIKNRCLNYTWEHAYKLMKHDEIIEKAKQEASTNALKGLQKEGPPSINTSGGGDTKASEWEAISKMSPDALEAHIETYDDAKMTKFLKEAPASIRAKIPTMPWK